MNYVQIEFKYRDVRVYEVESHHTNPPTKSQRPFLKVNIKYEDKEWEHLYVPVIKNVGGNAKDALKSMTKDWTDENVYYFYTSDNEYYGIIKTIAEIKLGKI